MTRADLDPALHGIAVYNPDLLSRDELKRYFIARRPLLERMLADLRQERPGVIAQHRLILGQRGMGKTSLLRRLAIAVDEDPALSRQWLALTFPEEQYNIGRLADLWLNCLDAVGDALERAGREGCADDLDARIDELAGADPATVLQALLEQAHRLGRRLLLLLDNADLILGRLRKEDWALREALQSHPELTVYAASAGAIEASYQYDAAFYDFFRIQELKGLTADELHETLIRLSEIGRTPAVAELVATDPARIRTLHTLTGGNPRTVVLLYGVLAQGPAGDVRSDLEGLLDRVTPLYKARFEELPDLGQRLVDGLALHWDPAGARQLAERLGWEVNLVSAQLKRLQDQGLVEKVAPFKGKRALFQLAERFFNIWYLMRASRRVRRKLTWLVRFLRIFYTPTELRQRAKHQLALLRTDGRDGPRQAEYSLALAQCVADKPLRSALETHGLRGLVDDGETRRRLAEILDLRGEDAELATRAERLQLLAEARQRISDALRKAEPDLDHERLLLLLLGSPSLSLAEKRQTGERAAALGAADWLELDRVQEEELKRLERRFGVDPTPLYRAIADGDMEDAKDTDGAAAAFERLGDRNLPAMAWLGRWTTGPASAEEACNAVAASRIHTAEAWLFRGYQLQVHLGRFAEAEQAYRRAIEIDSDYAVPWYNLGSLLQVHLGRFAEAEQAYRRAIEIDPNHVSSWNNLGNLLQDHLARYAEAEQAYRRAIEIDPNFAYPWNGLGNLLDDHLARYAEAEQAYRRAIEIDSNDAVPWYNLGNLLQDHLARYAEAEQAYRRAIEIDPNFAYPWKGLGNLLQVHLSRYAGAEQAYRRAIEIDPNYASPWYNLGHLLDDHLARYAEAEQAYRRAIEIDPESADDLNALAWSLYRRDRNLDEAQSLAEQALGIAPSDQDIVHTLASLRVRQGDWPSAATLIRRLIDEADAAWLEASWDEILGLFHEAVLNGKAAEARDLLDADDAGERWRPLREALAAAAEGSADYLRQVAPEVAGAAREIHARLTAPRLAPLGAEDAATASASDRRVD